MKTSNALQDHIEDQMTEIVVRFGELDAAQQEGFLAELEQLKQKYMEG